MTFLIVSVTRFEELLSAKKRLLGYLPIHITTYSKKKGLPPSAPAPIPTLWEGIGLPLLLRRQGQEKNSYGELKKHSFLKKAFKAISWIYFVIPVTKSEDNIYYPRTSLNEVHYNPPITKGDLRSSFLLSFLPFPASIRVD